MSVAAPEPAVIPIYQGQDFYVPTFELKVRGRALPSDIVRDVLQVTYRDDLEQIDSFEVTINNWDAEARAFKYSDAEVFNPGTRVELAMGYFGGSGPRLMMTGQITALRPSFPSGGQPTLVVSALNLLHELRGEQRSRVYRGLRDSDIAQQIAGRLNIPIRLDEAARAKEETYKFLAQTNMYDIMFLMERARRIGYDLFVREFDEQGRQVERAMHFVPSVNVQRVTYRLTYGRSLIEFQPTLDTANQVGSVTVRSRDPLTKTTIEHTARRGELTTRGVTDLGGQSQIEQTFSKRQEVITTTPVSSKQEARTLARETLERMAKELVKGSGSTVGLPDIRAGTALVIDGVGTRFSGRYFVTATTHQIGDSGYTTQFECRREELTGR